MPHNQPTNKISAFIGITLLLLVLGFTVFINIPKQEKEKEFKPFTQNEADDFWRLIDMETKYKDDDKSVIEIRKKIKNKVLFDSLNKNQNFTENENEIIYYYGDLVFLSDNKQNKSKVLGFEVWEQYNEENKIYLSDIGHLFTKYNISFVSSTSTNWNFTIIDLRDGRKMFLIKEGTKIFSNYENELIEKANRINDSTRIILPLAIKEIRKKYFKTEEKERINLFSF